MITDMGKTLLTAIAFTLLPLFSQAQTYKELWKQYEEASQKDLPRTQMQVLEKILATAEKKQDYGQQLAASLSWAGLQTTISPDSLEGEVTKLRKKQEKAEKSNVVLSAVYATVLGKIYQNNSSLENGEQLSKQYFEKALTHPDALASYKESGYEPFISTGVDSKYFDHDLLHVIGIEANNLPLLYNHYQSKGNREAACLIASMQEGNQKVEVLDSLIDIYADLPICGALAVKRFGLMPNSTNAERKLCYEYLQQAINRWGSWKEMNQLRNRLSQMEISSISANLDSYVSPSQTSQTLRIAYKHLQSATITITKTKLHGDNELVDNPEVIDAEDLKSYLIASSTQTISHPFASHPIYEINNDSIVIPPLDKGIYFVTLTTNQEGVDTIQFLYCVTDLYVLHQQQPNDQWRYVVVNATTGKPIKGATLCFIESNYNKKKKNATKHTFTTNAKGEAIIDNTKGDVSGNLYVYTNDDTAYPTSWHRNSFSLNKQSDKTRSYARIYTDRSVYRPGQTVYANVLAWNVDKGINAEVLTQKSVTLTLRDANRRVVAEHKFTLDDNGSCATSFTLPSSGLTGTFNLTVTGAATSYQTIKVEEYKRPTFEVTLNDCASKYAVGDTVTLSGKAQTYAGVPVQNAKVSYTVTRRPRWWFWYRANASRDTEIITDSTSTNDAGEYTVKVPLSVDEKEENGFFVFEVTATVTDNGGESHEANQSLPIGAKPSVLLCNLPSRMEVTQTQPLKFTYLNVAGKEIPGEVRYAIFDESTRLTDLQMAGALTQKAIANKTISLPTLKSGQYTLMATCGNDTIKQHFVLFSLKDKSPVVDTQDWFYLSADTFPSDGKPVYIQVGSSDKDQHFVYSIVSEGKVIENGTFDQSNALTLHRFSYKEEYGTGLVINYAWVRNGVVYTHTAKIARPMPDKRLILQWNSFRNRLTPGQNEEWTLTIKRPNGKAANTQLMATMYDKSLDQIQETNWSDDIYLTNNMPSLRWLGIGHSGYSQYHNTQYNALKVEAIQLSAFNDEYFNNLCYAHNRYHLMYKLESAPMLAMNRSSNSGEALALNDVVSVRSLGTNQLSTSDSYAEESAAAKGQEEQSGKQGQAQAQIRENLNETAFFYPQLHTDSAGCVSLTFTLPESLTTWRFLGLAHDSKMNHGMITEDIVAQKQVMITPNVPRFLRKDDKAVITARLFNTTTNMVQGKALMELVDPLTDKVVYTSTQDFSVDGESTAQASFAIDDQALKGDGSMLIARFTASGDGFSDGEQHYLPILSQLEYVTTTVPFTQTSAGVKTINLNELFPKKNISSKSLTIEYTNNPSWLMIQALPYVGDANDQNAISLATAFYANRLAKHIVDSTPKIKDTFSMWLQEKGNETSLMSSLEKNQDLKNVVLEETPWVIDAQNEQEQKHAIAHFFNDNQLSNTTSSTLQRLKQLQNSDGSFSWWKGMKGSLYMTVTVAKTLARLNNQIGNDQEVSNIISRAFKYLDSEVSLRVIELKKLEKQGYKHLKPSDALCDYLYTNALAGRSATADTRYLIGLLTKKSVDLTIYGKANTAIILHQYSESQKAKEYLESIKQYTVYKEGMGRYFDSRNAMYSWFDYQIPTEVAAIEALKAITPNDSVTIQEMQQWLLQAKHTQAWDTPINSVNAIWAFSDNGQMASLASTDCQPASIAIDGKALDVTASAGIGYVKVKADASTAQTLTVDKKTDGTSWGAVYAQYLQPTTEVEDAQSGIAIKREVLNPQGTDAFKVGDKIQVRLTITADRDYDFVQVVDKRAACLEPVNTTSGYSCGYYIATKDNATCYYFDQLAKGKHVIETEYYVDREGSYQQGTCTAQCAYAPEFSGRTKGAILNINK